MLGHNHGGHPAGLGLGGHPGAAGGFDHLASSSSASELKTQFMTREGLYSLSAISEYSRPNRVGLGANNPVMGGHSVGHAQGPQMNGQANTGLGSLGAPVRVSFAPAVSGGSAASRGRHGSGASGASTVATEDGMSNGYNGSVAPGRVSERNREEKIAFNYGREIFVYPYKGVKRVSGHG